MTEKIKIRQALRDDAPAIHELHTRSVKELCKDPSSSGQISGWLNHRTPEGYFPSVDHSVPPDVTFENYCYYISLMREVAGLEKLSFY